MNLEDTTFQLEKVLEVFIAFNSEQDYFDLLNVILDKMMEMTNADAGTLYVLEDDMLHFRILKNISLNIFRNAKDKIDLPPIFLDENNIDNISAYSAIKNERVSVDDVYTDERFNFSGPKNYDKLTGYRTCSMLVFPLSTTDGEVIGVIQLLNAIDRKSGEIKPFNDIYDLSVMLALARVSANALANILYAKEIDELFKSFVRVMTKAIDERSPYNVNHTNNTARYCDAFTVYLNERFAEGHEYRFGKNRRDQLVMAAYLHDIGKIITPLSVMDKEDRLWDKLEVIKLRFEIKKRQLECAYLRNAIDTREYEKAITDSEEAVKLIERANKTVFLDDAMVKDIKKLSDITYIDTCGEEVPILTANDMESLSVRKGTLTKAEREIMQEHVSITERLLNNMKFNKYYKNVSAWAAGHHEFLDGSGYPLGLKGSQISIEVCIITIADIFDALTADDRPYKKSLPVEKALEILRSMASEGKLHKELTELFAESGVWVRQ